MRRTRGIKFLLYAMHANAYFDEFETNQKQITEKSLFIYFEVIKAI